MWLDQVANPRPLALESDALQTAPRGPAFNFDQTVMTFLISLSYTYIQTSTYSEAVLWTDVFLPCAPIRTTSTKHFLQS